MIIDAVAVVDIVIVVMAAIAVVTMTVTATTAQGVRIAYDREDYRARGPVYDIVLDSLGGTHTLDAFAVLKPGGVVVSVAGPPDDAAPPGADDDRLLPARLVAIAVGADVRAVAVDLAQPRDARPHVLEPDAEQQPARAFREQLRPRQESAAYIYRVAAIPEVDVERAHI